MSEMSAPGPLLRHLVATLAYRAAKVLRDVPPGFASFASEGGRRTPLQIVAHLGDLIGWAVSITRGEQRWVPQGSDDWDVEVRRFFAELGALDQWLATGAVSDEAAHKLIQGPLADALTHVGQLALLRGAAGVPIRPESYANAEIVQGRVGLEQAPPGREFDGDASARRA